MSPKQDEPRVVDATEEALTELMDAVSHEVSRASAQTHEIHLARLARITAPHADAGTSDD